MIWGVLGILGIVMSTISITATYLVNRRRKLFQKHIVASRQHLLQAVDAFRQGDVVRGELELAASQEELDRSEYYST